MKDSMSKILHVLHYCLSQSEVKEVRVCLLGDIVMHKRLSVEMGIVFVQVTRLNTCNTPRKMLA